MILLNHNKFCLLEKCVGLKIFSLFADINHTYLSYGGKNMNQSPQFILSFCLQVYLVPELTVPRPHQSTE